MSRRVASHYALSERAARAIRKYGTEDWEAAVQEFLAACGNLAELYRKQRTATLIPVVLSDDTQVMLSPGMHNQVHAAVITEFAPRFAAGAKVLYLGDTANKDLYFDTNALRRAGVPVTEHDKFPDIILYDEQKRWLFLIEVVTSHGPMSPKRVLELEEMLKDCTAGKVFVMAFPDFAEFRKHSRDIAWETEVWLADIPDHMIHYNQRFTADFELKEQGAKGMGLKGYKLYHTVEDAPSRRSFEVYPDALIILRGTGDHESVQRLYFLEVDRGTEPLEQVRQKILGYHYFRQQGVFRKYGRFHQDRFRVLLQTGSPKRAANIRAALQGSDSEDLVLITAAEQVREETILKQPIWERISGRKFSLVT